MNPLDNEIILWIMNPLDNCIKTIQYYTNNEI